MKLGYIAIVTLLIIQCTLWRSLAASDCLTKNPILARLKTQSVQVYATKYTNSDQIHNCAEEWKPYGTCCEQYSLKHYADKDKAHTDHVLHQLDNAAKSLISKTSELMVTIARLESFPSIQLTPTMKKISEVFKSNQLTFSRDALIKLSDKISLDFSKCVDRLINSRGSSLCYTCSGRSEKYYAGGKLVISDQVCSSVYASCITTLLVPLELTARFIPVFDILMGLELKLPANPSPYQVQSVDAIKQLQIAFICKNRASVRDLRKRLLTGSPTAKVEFCERLIRLNEPLYFEHILKEIELSSRVVSLLGEEIQHIERVQTAQGWSLHARTLASRRLLTGLSFDAMFKGDVVVAPLVSAQAMHSSTDVASHQPPGVTIGTSTGLIPVSLTQRFP